MPAAVLLLEQTVGTCAVRDADRGSKATTCLPRHAAGNTYHVSANQFTLYLEFILPIETSDQLRHAHKSLWQNDSALSPAQIQSTAQHCYMLDIRFLEAGDATGDVLLQVKTQSVIASLAAAHGCCSGSYWVYRSDACKKALDFTFPAHSLLIYGPNT
jgi:predicted secreted protein